MKKLIIAVLFLAPVQVQASEYCLALMNFAGIVIKQRSQGIEEFVSIAAIDNNAGNIPKMLEVSARKIVKDAYSYDLNNRASTFMSNVYFRCLKNGTY